MTQPAKSEAAQSASTTSTNASPAVRDRMNTGDGHISVAENVVQKIAGKACREVAGVHAMGTSGTRAFGSIRERIPGSTGPNVAQGVGVEVGTTEAAIETVAADLADDSGQAAEATVAVALRAALRVLDRTS